MLRKLYCTGLLLLVSSSLGCTLCCSPDDGNYGAYGGRWQRHDPASGRVGSVFAEAGYDSLGEAMAPGDSQLDIEHEHVHPISYEAALDDAVSSYID